MIGLFCPECGFQNAEDNNFCTNCSLQFKTENVATAIKVKKPIYSKWWFWLIILLISSAIIANIQNASKTYVEETITKDSVINSMQDSFVSKYITDVINENGTVTIVVYFEDVLDAKLFVQCNQYYSAEVFETVFKNETVNKVIYQADVSMQDAYGNEERATGQKNWMLREDANKITNWDNFTYEAPSLFYSVVNFELSPTSNIPELQEAWINVYY